MTVRRREAAAVTGLLVALCCGLATVVLHRVFVGTTAGQAVDQAALEQAGALPALAHAGAGVLLSAFTLPVVLLAGVLPPAVALLRRHPWHALAAVGLLVGANATTQLLKVYVFDRPDLLSLGAPNSLPSGHTTLAASIALGFAVVAAPAWRVPTAACGLAASTVVGLATVVLGWHRLSDVVAALLVTAAWAGAMLAVVVLRPRRRPAGADDLDEPPGPQAPTVRRAELTAHR
jgi:membrane-associated phospholipid phosphatase